MRFYTHRHKYYCGIDLHATVMYVCITDAEGRGARAAVTARDEARDLALMLDLNAIAPERGLVQRDGE